MLVGYEFPDPDDEELRGHAVDLLHLIGSNNGNQTKTQDKDKDSIATTIATNGKIEFIVVTDMSAEFEQICAPTMTTRSIAQQYYSSYVPSW